jgi:signal transduction histidine kinase/ligand-binding sensor domain-containing protein
MRKSYYFLVLLSIISVTISVVVSAQPSDQQCIRYTTKDGLPDGNIGSIIQDKSGFLWIVAEGGLSRFDGYSFKKFTYEPDDTNSLRETEIWDIYLDPKSRLWLISARWLYLYHPDQQTFEHFSIGNLAKDNFLSICTLDGDKLVLGGGKSLYKFDIKKKKFSFFRHEILKPSFFWDYLKGEKGIEWIAMENGLARYDNATRTNIFIDSGLTKEGQRRFNNLIPLSSDYFLAVNYYNSVLLVNKTTNVIEQFHPASSQLNKPPEANDAKAFQYYNTITCSYKLNDSIIVLATNGGLSFFNWRTRTSTWWEPDKAVNSGISGKDNRIYGILRDREGIYWIGGQHLKKYDFKDFNVKKYPVESKDNTSKLFAAYYDLYHCANKNLLLFGPLGMCAFNPATDEFERDAYKNLSEARITEVTEDGTGRIWAMGEKKIFSFTLNGLKPEHIRQLELSFTDSPDMAFCDINLDRSHHILLATKKGLMVLDTTGKLLTALSSDSKPPGQITNRMGTAICNAGDGRTWLGTVRGLNRIGKDGRTVKQFRHTNQLLSDWAISDIVEDKRGFIWFSTSEFGIGRVNPVNDSVSFIATKQGLPSNWIKKLYLDNDGNIWAQSTAGILKINAMTLQSELYSEEQGFPLPEDICRIHYSKYTGSLFVLTHYAVFEITVQKMNRNLQNVEIALTGFSIFDVERQVPANKEIHLDYTENFINIQFAGLSYHNNKQTRYAYKLEGLDKSWVYSNFKRNASYTNLTPGRYNFIVKAQMPGGAWTKPASKLLIIITPPYWQQWWFNLLEVLAAAAFIMWIIRLYTQRKLAKQKSEFEKRQAVSAERIRIASDMHDDLGSGLTSIRLLSEVARIKAGIDNPAKPEIEKILNAVSNLSESLKEILWTMNTRFDRLEDFVIYLRSYSVAYFDNSPIKFEFARQAFFPEILIHGELRRNIFLCIKEALHNILKHSEASKAALRMEFVGNVLTVKITDNGIGIFSVPTDNFGNGLNTMKERLLKCGSQLEIQTHPGQGTTLSFKINIPGVIT